MAVKVDLLPSYSIGRYFQLAALALSGSWPIRESVVFSQASDYAKSMRVALERIAELKVGDKVSVAPDRACEALEALCERIAWPKFAYNYSVDADVARKLRVEEVKGCEVSAANVCHLAVVYVERLLRGEVSDERVKLPMLLRSTIFGKIKGPHAAEVEEAGLASVGVALLGVLASYLGAVRIGDSRYEYYLLPDGSHRSLKYFTPVAEVLGGVMGEAQYAIPEVSRVLTSVGGLSIDLASYLATLMNVLRSAETAEKALGLASSRAFESLLLARLEVSGNRPQVLWVGSLAVSDALLDLVRERLDATLVRLYRLVQRAERARIEHLAAAASVCVNSAATATLATVAESARVSALLDCARSLASLLDSREIPQEIKAMVQAVLDSFSRG